MKTHTDKHGREWTRLDDDEWQMKYINGKKAWVEFTLDKRGWDRWCWSSRDGFADGFSTAEAAMDAEGSE